MSKCEDIRNCLATVRGRGVVMFGVLMMFGLMVFGAFILLRVVLGGHLIAKRTSGDAGALQVAEAGLHMALNCMNKNEATNCGGTYDGFYEGQQAVVFDGGTYTTVVTGTGPTREIVSTGQVGGRAAVAIRATLTTEPVYDDEAAFHYALQAGDGGVMLRNNGTIMGSLYAGGDVTCTTTLAVVDGEAYVAKAGGTIDGCHVSHDAHADRVLDSVVTGDAYYRADPDDIAGTTVAGTRYPGSATPPSADLPQVDVDFWRRSAEYGGVHDGNLVPADGQTIGPIKVAGNLVIGQNVDVLLAGPVWVTGSITTAQNSSIGIVPSFGPLSTTILGDDPANNATGGRIEMQNNTTVNGSGDPKSFILFVSTNSSMNDADPAMRVSNNANGAVFYAPNGVLRLQSNATAKSLAAKRLYLDENATVSFVDSGLSDARFANGPAGRWRIIPETWRLVK